jgi:uncharacterized protein (DUF2235 family)
MAVVCKRHWGRTMPKNIVICCDGTSNEIKANLTNVLKLYRTLRKNSEQLVFYDPGVGTIESSNAWAQFTNRAYRVFALATGSGLDRNVLDAYMFLVDSYEEGDRIYLFGFSRGAYTVRVLAGMLRLIGLLRPEQKNLSNYAIVAYKRAANEKNLEIGGRFERVLATRRVPIKFLGLWDTVSSMIVPRPDRFYVPSLQSLPFTKTNSFVEVVRHAVAIDERRRMFRLYGWNKGQPYKPNPFSDDEGRPQDIKEVWFAGSHSDVVGGYPENESGMAKFSLKWMIDEAAKHGLLMDTNMFNHLVLGHSRAGGSKQYVAPNHQARLHSSMNSVWPVLEMFPKRKRRREWPKRMAILGFYIPWAEPRRIGANDRIHRSVLDRMRDCPYRPVNLPAPDPNLIEE